jgi:hypothetical protein
MTTHSVTGRSFVERGFNMPFPAYLEYRLFLRAHDIGPRHMFPRTCIATGALHTREFLQVPALRRSHIKGLPADHYVESWEKHDTLLGTWQGAYEQAADEDMRDALAASFGAMSITQAEDQRILKDTNDSYTLTKEDE